MEVRERHFLEKMKREKSDIYRSAEQTESIAKLLILCFDIHFSHKAVPGESWHKSFTVRPRKDTHGVV